jgi:hypothetical protein
MDQSSRLKRADGTHMTSAGPKQLQQSASSVTHHRASARQKPASVVRNTGACPSPPGTRDNAGLPGGSPQLQTRALCPTCSIICSSHRNRQQSAPSFEYLIRLRQVNWSVRPVAAPKLLINNHSMARFYPVTMADSDHVRRRETRIGR